MLTRLMRSLVQTLTSYPRKVTSALAWWIPDFAVVSLRLYPCRYGARAICSPHYRATRSYRDSVTIQVQASCLVTCTGNPPFQWSREMAW